MLLTAVAAPLTSFSDNLRQPNFWNPRNRETLSNAAIRPPGLFALGFGELLRGFSLLLDGFLHCLPLLFGRLFGLDLRLPAILCASHPLLSRSPQRQRCTHAHKQRESSNSFHDDFPVQFPMRHLVYTGLQRSGLSEAIFITNTLVQLPSAFNWQIRRPKPAAPVTALPGD